MNTQTNNSPSFRTRLAAFLLVLAIGFVMGWVNGHSGTASTPAAPEAAEPTVTQSVEEAEGQKGQDRAAETTTDTSAATPADEGSSNTDAGTSSVAPERGPTASGLSVTEDGQYTSKDEVALYIHTYGHLPSNYISKTKARNKGWVASEGNLQDVCPGMSIGGSEYYNDEGELPDANRRRWTECDINYHGGYRGAERIVFSNDGLIFYTSDHYQTFEQLY